MDTDQRKSEDGLIDTPKYRSTSSLGRQSVVSTDRDGNVNVSVKPGPFDANFSADEYQRRNKPRGSFNDDSLQLEVDSLGTKIVPEPEEEEFEYNKCTLAIEKVHLAFRNFLSKRKQTLKRLFYGVLLVAYFVYFGFAVYTSPTGATVVIVLTCLVVFYFVAKGIWRKAGKQIYACCCAPAERLLQSKFWSYFRW